mmetsp:Transcript_30575/g.71818  ORF Transcript_30575/g.71818 Transcript_30575/m.71818 type:complete len:117 (+) Transcript_30575:2-352(+)
MDDASEEARAARPESLSPTACQDALAEAMKSRFVRNALKQVSVNVVARNCEGACSELAAYFRVPPGDEIVLCCNKLRSAEELHEFLRHELVHAFDVQMNGVNLGDGREESVVNRCY